MRRFTLLLLMFTPACGWVEGQREAAAQAASAATLAETAQLLSQTLRTAEGMARSADRVLRPLPVMTPAEEAGLRRFLNPSHVARARALGVRVEDRVVRDSLLEAGRLVLVEDSTSYWIVRPGASPAYLVPEMRALLEVLGQRLQGRLHELGLPPYRLEVTSALRTSARQERLRATNDNAAAGVSSHEFGTTVDLSYAAFAPPADVPQELLASAPLELRPHLEQIVDLAMESVLARKSREIGAIFSRVLREAQAEGLVLVIYERQQTVYHVTVAQPIDPGAG